MVGRYRYRTYLLYQPKTSDVRYQPHVLIALSVLRYDSVVSDTVVLRINIHFFLPICRATLE